MTKVMLSLGMLSTLIASNSWAEEINTEEVAGLDNLYLTQSDEEAIDRLIVRTNSFLNKRALQDSGSTAMNPGDVVFNPTDGSPTDPYNPDPVDTPIGTDLPTYDPGMEFPYGGTTSKRGVTDKIALEVLYQTLEFYGVKHQLSKTGTIITFKILKSESGYFSNLTKLDIAYALREFSGYLAAQLCNEVNYQNVYAMFTQVPKEEIGLRFKYDMAWALFGNALPKEPNNIMKLGTRWAALERILSNSKILTSDSGAVEMDAEGAPKVSAMKSWMISIKDIVGVLVGLNKLMCFVDVRPNPKEELKKRVVVKKILEMERDMLARYKDIAVGEIVKQARQEGQSAQLDALKEDVKNRQ